MNTTHLSVACCLLQSGVVRSLEVKRTEVPTACWLWRDTSAIRRTFLPFVPCTLSPRNTSGGEQKSNCSVVLENFKATRHTWNTLDGINTSHRRAASIAPNGFFDVLCVVFNVTHGIKMQDLSQKFASESKSGIHPNA